MDTGGIGMQPEMTSVEIQNATEQQADFAIRAATLLLFVVDGRDGLLPWMKCFQLNSERWESNLSW